MNTVVSLNNVSKIYKKYNNNFYKLLSIFYINIRVGFSSFKALNDINLEIHKGESVGLIGLNGSGKSTLLKLIAGITEPTTGSLVVNGRVIAILELGVGFNPHLTGYQNALISCNLFGIHKNQTKNLLIEIEKFTDIGDFFHKEIKTYSSGMIARLAFATATSLKPDILIIDEALAVGDIFFQQKCFNRIHSFIKSGITVLFVSHDLNVINSLCSRAILIDKGKILFDGRSEDTCNFYNGYISTRNEFRKDLKFNINKNKWGLGFANVISIKITNVDYETISSIITGEKVILSIVVKINIDLPILVLGFSIKNQLGQTIFGTNTHYHNMSLKNVKVNEHYIFECSFHANLGPGEYTISTSLVDSANHIENNYEWLDFALRFEVINTNINYFIGNTSLNPKFIIKYL